MPIDGDRIRAADLARAIPAFAKTSPERDIGAAPLAGIERRFSPEEVFRIGARLGVVIDKPVEVCFERSARLLSEDVLLPVLTRALAMPDARVEILEFSRFPVVEGAMEFSRAGLSSNGFWRGSVARAGRSNPIWARIRVLDAQGAPVSLAPARAPRQTIAPPEIERGDRVQVEVSSGGVLLAFEASAETAGRAGDAILIKNPENGRRFQARVEGKGKVSLRR